MAISQILIQDTPGVFNGNTNIVSVDLRNTKFVNDTMNQTFGYCENLTAVTNIPNSIVNATDTFRNCINLTTLNLTLPHATNLTNVCDYCRKLNNLILNAPAVTNLSGAFSFTNVSNIDIPPAVTDLSHTFSGCDHISGVITIPASVVTINGCFLSTNITGVQFLGNNLSYAAEVFTWMDQLTEAPILPPSLSNMARTYTQATSIVNCNYIQNTVEDMYRTFSYANYLVKLGMIPANVININGTFQSCANLAGDIYINSTVIQDAKDCFIGTTVDKQVYIPFTYNIPFSTLYCWETSKDPRTPDRPKHLYTTTTSPTKSTTLYYADGTIFNKKTITSASTSNIRLTGAASYESHNRKSAFDIINGAVTRTYNAFITAGYTNDGTKNGVYLQDIAPILQTQNGTVTY